MARSRILFRILRDNCDLKPFVCVPYSQGPVSKISNRTRRPLTSPGNKFPTHPTVQNAFRRSLGPRLGDDFSLPSKKKSIVLPAKRTLTICNVSSNGRQRLRFIFEPISFARAVHVISMCVRVCACVYAAHYTWRRRNKSVFSPCSGRLLFMQIETGPLKAPKVPLSRAARRVINRATAGRVYTLLL